MAALDYLKDQGLTARRTGMRIRVSPLSKLTDEVRRYVKRNRLALIAELVADDGVERRCHWQVIRAGKPLCIMLGEPLSRDEALSEVRWRWPDADLP